MTPQNRAQAPAEPRARGNTAQPHASRSSAPTRSQNRKRNAPRWTPHELTLLREHYPLGGYKAVQAAGVKRSRNSITARASEEELTNSTSPPSVRVMAHQLAPRQPVLRPSRPKRITDQLHALAETPGLTPREYEREKAEILRGDTT